MNQQQINWINKSSGRTLQLVEMPDTFHRDAMDYMKTFTNRPKYVLLVISEDNIYHTSAEDNKETSDMINRFDVRYVFDTNDKQFYKVV